MRQFIAKEGDQMTRFLVVGGICVSTYYAILIGLTELFEVWYIVSAIVAFAIFYVVQFTLQKFWAFRNLDRERIKRQLILYSIMAAGNWVINTSLLYVLVEYAHMWYVLAQAILTALVSIAAYFGFRWIFRHHQPPH